MSKLQDPMNMTADQIIDEASKILNKMDKLKAYQKEYREAHKAKCQLYQQNYRARQKLILKQSGLTNKDDYSSQAAGSG